MLSRHPRLTVALIITTVLGLTVVGTARLAGPVTRTAVDAIRLDRPVDPSDLSTAAVSTELRVLAEPRLHDGSPWSLALVPAMVMLLVGLAVLGLRSSRVDRSPTRWVRVTRAPPGGRLRHSG